MNKKLLFSIILVILLLTPTTVMADTTESCPCGTVQEYIETVTVSSDGSTKTSTNVLECGVTYLLEASGTYRFGKWGDYGIADSEWAYRNDGYKDNPLAPHGWTLGENTYPSVLGLDILVDGQNVFWGDFNPEHVYTILFNGTGNEVDFSIFDSAYGDNSGSLTVDIYECEFQRYAEITSPEEDEIVFGSADFGAYLVDNDYDYVNWAVRKGTCKPGNNVFGNVGGLSDAYDWAPDSEICYKYNFMATADTCEWDAGKYCFIFNPVEDSCEADIRLTRWFYVADVHVNGGGQIIEEEGDKKDWYKISFGGGIWGINHEIGIADGEWEVNFHNVSIDDLNKTKFHTTDIEVINFVKPTSNTCVAAMNFEAYGEWNGKPGYKLTFRAGDYDSPSSLDTVRIELYDPDNIKVYDTSKIYGGGVGGDFTDESDCAGPARTTLDKGNIKIDFCQ